jgi:hypothetical protein
MKNRGVVFSRLPRRIMKPVKYFESTNESKERFMNRMHPIVRQIGIVALAVGAIVTAAPAFAAPAPSPTVNTSLQTVVPPGSNEQLHNPGMGIYFPGTVQESDMPANAWFTPIIDIGYFRDEWARLEPARGDYQFAKYFDPIFDLWVKKLGKRVAFRFMSSNMHSRQKYVTPQWVFDAGVPFVVHKGLYVPEQIDPVFWDEKYLQIQEEFIAALGRYLNGREGVEFVDIGGIGEWGEMHLARWTSEELERTGYTPAKYVAAYRRLIDAHARAFPHTRVFLNVGDWAEINDYAAIRGQHFRQDGLNPAGPSHNVGKRFYHPYSRRGVITNYELFSGYDEMLKKGWGVRETFEKGLEDPISYFHINLGGFSTLQKLPDDVKTVVRDTARRLGFRFALTRLQCNRALRVRPGANARLLLEHTWKNSGVAPCYDSYALQWTLRDAQGRTLLQETTYPKTPTTQWWPGEEINLRDVISVPAKVLEGATGPLRLAVSMTKPETPALQIQLAQAKRDDQGRYELANLEISRQSNAEPAQIFSANFEGKEVGRWGVAQGMKSEVVAQAHEGKQSLHIAGTQGGSSWNYATTSVPQPILPASRYRLTCWMKVDSISDANRPPFLKLGVNDAAGKWINNFATNRYDTARLGTWQQLTGFIETPANAARADIAVEKGDLESAVTLSFHLDDVRLELLETP